MRETGAALKPIAMDGLEGDDLACQVERVTLLLTPEEAALVRCIARERGTVSRDRILHDLLALGAEACGAQLLDA